MKLNSTDRKILALVQADSSLSYAAIGAEVALSVSAVNERVRKLERGGAIRRYVAVLDPAIVGAEVLAFLEIALDQPADGKAVLNAALARPEVQEIHRISGEAQYLLKLRLTSLGELQATVDEILALAGARQTRLTLALGTVKQQPDVPIAASV